MSETGQSANNQALDLLYRHRSTLIWLAVLAFVVWMQWPMIKGTFYRLAKIPAPADGIAWRTDFQGALAESKQTGKSVLLDFSASWCPPCQVMKHEVWPDEQVRQAVEAGYVPVLMDVDAPTSQEAAQRYNVEAIPTIIIVNPDGQMVRRGASMSKRAMLKFLKSSA